MTVLPYIVAYLGVIIFVIAVIARFVKLAKTPLHLRWELYPVAHEGGGRAEYGGSYLEEPEWWTKKREVSLWGEIKEMVPEILFLVALKKHNPKLWIRSFPFHFGMYLLAGWAFLMAIAGLLARLAPALMTETVGSLFGHAITVLGVVGLVLATLGGLGLLQRRLTAKELKMYSTPADLLNLVFFVVAFGFTAVSFLVCRTFAPFWEFVRNLVTFNLAPLSGSGMEVILPTISIMLLVILLAYIPLTHMSHFVAKYFAYHSIRWNDEPNLQGGKQEKVIMELLSQPITWAAPHIKADGKKTWADVATEEVE